MRANRGKIERRLGDVGAARLLLCGHSHRPDVVRLRSGATVVNPGSVGLPAAALDDGPRPHVMETGTPDARYALVELGDPTPVVMLWAVPYDHEAAARQAEACGFPQWADWVRTGWARPRS